MAIKQEIQEKKLFFIKIVSDSMEPLLNVGSKYTVVPVNLNQLKQFDIILFWQNDRPNAHFYWGKHLAGNIKGHMSRSLKYPSDVDLPIKDEYILGIIPIKLKLRHKIIFLWRYYFSKV
ncbi:hypothetical protein [Halobacteriovorax sp. JY17]|uniref:hypothetical protein n=1 Tax=Halobacteriovorax sp. JY17 TaxID=2014617 RepID=UPI0025C37D4B|nr:hypothetical protein [Halobacteriovorax sp. JY17]